MRTHRRRLTFRRGLRGTHKTRRRLFVVPCGVHLRKGVPRSLLFPFRASGKGARACEAAGAVRGAFRVPLRWQASGRHFLRTNHFRPGPADHAKRRLHPTPAPRPPRPHPTPTPPPPRNGQKRTSNTEKWGPNSSKWAPNSQKRSPNFQRRKPSSCNWGPISSRWGPNSSNWRPFSRRCTPTHAGCTPHARRPTPHARGSGTSGRESGRPCPPCRVPGGGILCQNEKSTISSLLDRIDDRSFLFVGACGRPRYRGSSRTMPRSGVPDPARSRPQSARTRRANPGWPT